MTNPVSLTSLYCM